MKPLVLVTGASGYVGGRLLPRLLGKGYRVRCLVRRPGFDARQLEGPIEIAEGDVFDEETLVGALTGVDTAYYLVHSMGRRESEDFEQLDRIGASNFARAANRAGVRRIIYLGGLGDQNDALSPHLRSRQEVGRILRSSGAQTIELRASIVIGSGSLSFEMIRALVERLPIMITPRWVRIVAQPIAIGDLLNYLLSALELPTSESRVYEIGGADVVSYGWLMREYARQRGLRRVMLPVPLLTPRLSSLWLGLVTPLYAQVGRKLIESTSHPTVVTDYRARGDFSIEPMGASAAIQTALSHEDQEFSATRWTDAVSSAGPGSTSAEGPLRVRDGRRLVDRRHAAVRVPPERAFRPIRRIGGRVGWYAYDWLWRLRGFIDLLAGGVGMRRGRPHPDDLEAGDTLDWWRVEAFEPDRRLLLRAEMKLPGRAWLEFEVTPIEDGSRIHQTAVFDPTGLIGLAYWYGVYPLHAAVFRGMLAGIAEAAEGS